MLEQTFTQLIRKYAEGDQSGKLWNEIIINYSDVGRYYHTLKHLEDVYNELYTINGMFDDWDAVLFALFYHDIIYKVNRTDNEAESAAIAQKRLSALSVPESLISRSVLHILATKGHSVSDDNDTNLFTDADLAVLGQDVAIYKDYSENVRKEYFIYPDSAYNKGRKKVLSYFLDMKQIYKTDYFFRKYETQARENIKDELSLL